MKTKLNEPIAAQSRHVAAGKYILFAMARDTYTLDKQKGFSQHKESSVQVQDILAADKITMHLCSCLYYLGRRM